MMMKNRIQGNEVIEMKQTAQNSSTGSELHANRALPEYFQILTADRMPAPTQESPGTDSEAIHSLEKIKESLVLAYLVANLNSGNLPLKAFMDSCEKKILLACLRFTGGSQKNAAAVMGIKPTVLFEKMRKHGINRRQLLWPGTFAPSSDKGE